MSPGRALVVGLLALAAWIVAVFWLWKRSPLAALILLSLSAIAVLVTVWRKPKAGPGAITAEQLSQLDPAEAEKQARFVVTRMLATLTRAQVAYLGQSFDDAREAKAWLKRALPRTYRGMLDDLMRDLEAARRGEKPDALRLALRVVERKDEVERIERTLNKLAESREGYALAHPVIYVVTGGVDLESGAEPRVVLLSSIDLAQPTLLPAVEVINVFHQLDGERRIRGQATLAAVRRVFGNKIEKLPGKPVVYETKAIDPHAEMTLETAQVGFVVSAGELA
ncbi:MAG: hypothetical protein KC503_11015 [Myxococcales bacterium]|nr:hypothetical protein [Myxococcales bacterium]